MPIGEQFMQKGGGAFSDNGSTWRYASNTRPLGQFPDLQLESNNITVASIAKVSRETHELGVAIGNSIVSLLQRKKRMDTEQEFFIPRNVEVFLFYSTFNKGKLLTTKVKKRLEFRVGW